MTATIATQAPATVPAPVKVPGKPLSNEARAVYARLTANRAIAKELKAQNDADTAWLLDFMGEADTALLGGLKVFKVISATNTSFDGKALLQGWPEAHEATVRHTPYKAIR